MNEVEGNASHLGYLGCRFIRMPISLNIVTPLFVLLTILQFVKSKFHHLHRKKIFQALILK